MGRGKHIKKPKKIQKKVEPKIEPDIAPISENEGELGLPKALAEAPKISKKDKKRATRENVLKMLQKLQNDSSSTESEKPAREVLIINKKL